MAETIKHVETQKKSTKRPRFKVAKESALMKSIRNKDLLLAECDTNDDKKIHGKEVMCKIKRRIRIKKEQIRLDKEQIRLDKEQIASDKEQIASDKEEIKNIKQEIKEIKQEIRDKIS